MNIWKWKNNTIVEVTINIEINEEKIKIIEVRTSVETLGTHISPSLNYRDEFEHVKQKMEVYMKKIMRTDMNMHQVCLYFNTRMLTNVFFGCGIVKFSTNQCDELKKTHELPIIRKIRLGDALPREML